MSDAESILNVDDYDPGRYARTKVLRLAGFSVLEATTGEETLRVAAERKPALILLDVNLPGMNGVETCRRLREDPETSAATIKPVIATVPIKPCSNKSASLSLGSAARANGPTPRSAPSMATAAMTAVTVTVPR